MISVMYHSYLTPRKMFFSEFLKEKLEIYIKQFNGLVKLFRNPERLGLITARTTGAKHSTGDVIVFLDAHCECNRNWLPPLLTRIKHDRYGFFSP